MSAFPFAMLFKYTALVALLAFSLAAVSDGCASKSDCGVNQVCCRTDVFTVQVVSVTSVRLIVVVLPGKIVVKVNAFTVQAVSVGPVCLILTVLAGRVVVIRNVFAV